MPMVRQWELTGESMRLAESRQGQITGIHYQRSDPFPLPIAQSTSDLTLRWQDLT